MGAYHENLEALGSLDYTFPFRAWWVVGAVAGAGAQNIFSNWIIFRDLSGAYPENFSSLASPESILHLVLLVLVPVFQIFFKHGFMFMDFSRAYPKNFEALASLDNTFPTRARWGVGAGAGAGARGQNVLLK